MFPRLTLLLLFVGAEASLAQDQDRKLVDRLLKPDMTLSYTAQNKQFANPGGVPLRAGPAMKSFYSPESNLAKNFLGTQEFHSSNYRTRDFNTRGAYVPRAVPAKTFSTRPQAEAARATEAGHGYATRSFAGERPFLAQGKSQKWLHAPDHPLSIDEVRELLNKNK